MSARPLVAVFAGVDGTGGAGLIADTRAIACGGGQALTITTAVTAQNLNGVKACWPLPTARVRTQFSTLCATSVDAIKIGVCGNAASVIIESIRHWRAPTVWDPVLSPTAGTAFISPTQRVQLVRRLLPHTCVITPNRQELTELSERRQVIDGVAVLLDAGARHVLITDCKKGATVHHALYGNNRQLLWERQQSADQGIITAAAVSFPLF